MTIKFLARQDDRFDKQSVLKFFVPKRFPQRVGTTKNHHNGSSKRELRRGVVTSESRRPGFMCICNYRSTHLQDFNTSSEYQTVDLSNKYTTKDFLRDFRHGYTLYGEQEDRDFDMYL
jgi:hypothetical protein